jgi:hypothetical protein
MSIDERKDGMWLLFKDLLDLEVQYEILCTPDGSDPNWDFEPSMWITNMGKTSMFCKINEKLTDLDVIMGNSKAMSPDVYGRCRKSHD